MILSFSGSTIRRWFFSEYPYAGMDFRGDPDLVMPAGEQWGVIGKLSDHISVYGFSL